MTQDRAAELIALAGKPYVNGFAIVHGQFGWSLIHVSKTTERQFKGDSCDGYSRYTRTVPTSECRYCGEEAPSRLLFERLISSDAQLNKEKHDAELRRDKRNGDLISSALRSLAKQEPVR